MTNPSSNDAELRAAISAYKKVCKVLGIKPATVDKDIELVDNATLVIVPDQVFSWSEIKKLAVEFGKEQSYSTWIYEDLYKLYSSEELSGKSTGQKYRVVRIAKNMTDADTVAEQRKKYAGEKVPSVLEAIVFWYTLRELGEPLDFDSAYIRHFDLPEKRLGGWSNVPDSCVDDDGGPDLGRSDSGDDREARLSVGSKTLSLATPSKPLELETDIEILSVRINGKVYRLEDDN